jgi:hypothetical protein
MKRCIWVLSQHVTAGTGNKHRVLQSGLPASRQEFKPKRPE